MKEKRVRPRTKKKNKSKNKTTTPAGRNMGVWLVSEIARVMLGQLRVL